MNIKMRKLFRSVQVYFPFLQDYKFMFQRKLRKVLNKTHEEDFEILPSLAIKKKLFVDIGANRGEAIQSMLMRSPGASIVAFEPNRYLCEKLRSQYGLDRNINIINCGLGNADAVFDLYTPFYNNYMFDGLSSFKEENARDWLVNRLYNFKKEKLEVKKMSCTVKKLDEFNLQPGFIKIDVQGFEYEVLQGAAETIKKHRPVLLIESPGKREIDFLTQLGYQPFMYKDGKLISGTKYYNIFFLPAENINEVEKKLTVVSENKIAA